MQKVVEALWPGIFDEAKGVAGTVAETRKAVKAFQIVADSKRTIKSSISGQAIEVLKRANEPLTLNELASRVKRSKAVTGADKIKDLKARVLKSVKWYVKDDHGWVQVTDEGRYFLTEAV